MKLNTLMWVSFATLIVLAILFNGEEDPFVSSGDYPAGKYIAWLAFLGFTAYSYHCGKHDNLFKTIKVMMGRGWGRQIGMDLYIGITLFIILTFVHQDSALIPILWILPALAFVNLASLLYIALHYDSLVSLFLG